jgi:[ribosomal protein S5]-alanine N-acetyltransferase
MLKPTSTEPAMPATFHLPINDEISLTEIRNSDKAAYLEHLACKEIYDHTLRMPYPYTEADADWWLNHVAEQTKALGQPINWAIREQSGKLIGGCGFHELNTLDVDRAEIGYWLARPYWGRGIMTATIQGLCQYAHEELKIRRLEAYVFDFNVASCRVLEKCGFRLKGRLHDHYRKDGRVFDALLYALAQ